MVKFPFDSKPRWYATELATTLFAAVPAFLTGAGGVIEGVRKGAPGVLELGVGVLVALAVGTVFKAVRSHYKDAREAARRSPRDLEGCLHTLHAAVLAMRDLRYDDKSIAKLRVTLFRVVESQDLAEQILPYVGGGGGAEGTKVSRRSGIVGRAILRGQPAGTIRDGSFDDYVSLLVNEYATPIEEARQLDDGRFAFVAIPLNDPSTGRVVGVVYMDSPDRTFFSRPGHPRDLVSEVFVQKIVGACAGLLAYAALRYPAEGATR
jgi:hypothetical protein